MNREETCIIFQYSPLRSFTLVLHLSFHTEGCGKAFLRGVLGHCCCCCCLTYKCPVMKRVIISNQKSLVAGSGSSGGCGGKLHIFKRACTLALWWKETVLVKANMIIQDVYISTAELQRTSAAHVYWNGSVLMNAVCEGGTINIPENYSHYFWALFFRGGEWTCFHWQSLSFFFKLICVIHISSMVVTVVVKA